MIQSQNQTLTRPGFFERHGFHLAIGVFVLTSSFLYGISAGISQRSGSAFAKYVPFLEGSGPLVTRLSLPDGVTVSPLGRDVTINDHPAEVVSFVSARAASDLVERQMATWKVAGMKVLGKAGPRRGVALAFDEARGERYSFSAWTVPVALRPKLSGGNPTQGFMSVSDAQAVDSSGGGSNGLVPDVPTKPGGKAGAVFSAIDPGGRTYTGAYTNPGGVGENIEYYRAELSSSGWRELHSETAPKIGAGFEVGNTVFQQAGEEIVLLFTPHKDVNVESGPQTVVSVTRGPINIERWRGLE